MSPLAKKRELNLREEQGALVGEIDIGCKNAAELCTPMIDTFRSINELEGVNIKINHHSVYSDTDGIDIEISFTSRLKNGAAARYEGRKPGGFFTRDKPASIVFTFDYANNPHVRMHEFGHALGHYHLLNYTNSVMSYSTKAATTFSEAEINAIRRAYR